MPLGIGLGLGIGRPRSGWTPSALGSSLIEWWDAEDAPTVTQVGGAVSAWRGKVLGSSAVQATAGSKPVYSASSFNNRPGITFDGVDDELTLAGVPAAFPVGATPGEIWVLADQKTAPGTAGSLRAFFYGDGDIAARGIYRGVTGGVNQATVLTGTGAASTIKTNTADYSGRHVVRAIFTATTIAADVDGAAGATSAAVSATATTRVRFAASSGVTASGFGNYTISAVLVTGALSAAQASLLTAYLSARR